MFDFDKMDGLEFERLVYNLLIKLGFRAQITKASGDGGVDIIANYEGLLFNGLYLIQCKRWKNKVGEPELRDLYGTVISENALKGILVTTSSFSRQAEEFCRGKNLELIDGAKLNELLQVAEMDAKLSSVIKCDNMVGFLHSSMFDNEKYQLLTNRIDVDPNLEHPHIALINLLMENVFDMGGEARTNGLISEAIARINVYNKIFTAGKTKVMKAKRNQMYVYLSVMELANADYGKAYEYLFKTEIPSVFNGNFMHKSIDIHRYTIMIAYILEFNSELHRLLLQGTKGIPTASDGTKVSHPDLISDCSHALRGTINVNEIKIPYPNRQQIEISDFLNKFKIVSENLQEHRNYVRSFGKIN